MVYQQLGVHAEEFEQLHLVGERAACHVAHGHHAVGLQLAADAASHTPEICQRPVVPQQAAVAHLVHFGYAHPIFVGRYVLGHDVHSHLAQIEVGAYARRGGDACLA